MIEPTPYASRKFEQDAVTDWIGKLFPAAVYLEIGSYLGGSLSLFGRAMEHSATLIAIDVPLPATNGGEKLLKVADNLSADGYDTHVLLGSSFAKNTRDRVRGILDGRLVDVILFDGLHTADAIAKDTKNFLPMVRPGGLVIFHDVGPCEWQKGTQKFIDALFPAWKALASRNARKMIVQERAGYGLVWLDEADE